MTITCSNGLFILIMPPRADTLHCGGGGNIANIGTAGFKSKGVTWN
eukprot:CAMPEP_0170125972 /NCGR_PEP_ID=MMETSP0020_2-20130122/19367_1 /TAXON_ID=98059 /ORGANISM="Dinobryon sp., Strain UTEXLB2267" /LENGTH=45 /DNA_ID= /DNA_START= /DNA_END= /DNA_ORIENTATION=